VFFFSPYKSIIGEQGNFSPAIDFSPVKTRSLLNPAGITSEKKIPSPAICRPSPVICYPSPAEKIFTSNRWKITDDGWKVR
jgi:hypothetical protein